MLDTRVKDWTTEDHDPPVERSYRSLWISFATFFAVAGAVWLLLFGVMRAFPYVQNGAEAVGAVKWRVAQGGSLLLDRSRSVRVLAFGNSKTLAGFHPAVFEKTWGEAVSAYNLAIPGESRFVRLLETALDNGARPTHVLVQLMPQTEPADASLWAFLLDNTRMADLLFPFRGFVRDAIVFAFESRGHGGPVAQYASNARQIEHLKEERGYYFIKSQSHFPGDRLPDDYSLPTDRPKEQMKRDAWPQDPAFARLMRLAEIHDFQVLVVPSAFRANEFAPPPATDATLSMLETANPRLRVLGPPYWRYDLKYFSDPVHLNTEGADLYSRQLAELVKDRIAGGR